MSSTADVVVCGAGIAGVAAAYHLAVGHGIRRVVLVDERPPLTLTSDKSTECYRGWWPGPGDAMVRLMRRSIDLLEGLARESGNFFHLNRNGYLYLTGTDAGARAMEARARAVSALGAGPIRVLRDGDALALPEPERFEGGEDGADLVLDPAILRRAFPFLTEDVRAGLLVRRAGWLSAQQLGMYLLEKARDAGATEVRRRLVGVRTAGGRVVGVDLADGSSIDAPVFVDAAGPKVGDVARLLGVELPVFHELHTKVTFVDALGIVPRHLPLVIWEDSIDLGWSDDERAELASDPALAALAGSLPGGVHFRPEGGPGSQSLLLLWAYDTARRDAVFPPRFDPVTPEIVLRGVARMAPGFAAYLEHTRRPFLDGGYYTKTAENRLLAGPLPVAGAYVLGALSGYGIMASMGAGELLAAHVTGQDLPPWAPAFAPSRYDDPEYRARFAASDATAGQL